MTKRPTKREAAQLVYVSGLAPEYRLQVNAHPTEHEFAAALRACQRVLDDKGGTTPEDWVTAEAAARSLLQRYDLHHNPTMPAGWVADCPLTWDTVRKGQRVKLVGTWNHVGHFGTVLSTRDHGGEAWVKLDKGGEYCAYTDALLKLRRARKGEPGYVPRTTTPREG